MGQEHTMRAGRGLRLVVAEPAQLGRRERRDEDAADRLGTGFRAAHLVDQLEGLVARSHVVPEDGVAYGDVRRVEDDHAVLLPTDRNGAGPVQEPRARPVERGEPGARVDRGAVGMGRGLLRDDLAGRGVDEERLGRLGGRVDAQHKVSSHATGLVRHLN
jgi:hypothetical protein